MKHFSATKRSGALPHATPGRTLNTVPSEMPDTQGHMVCNPISVAHPQQADPQTEQNVGSWVPGGRGLGGGAGTAHGVRTAFWGDGINVLEIDNAIVVQLCKCPGTHILNKKRLGHRHTPWDDHAGTLGNGGHLHTRERGPGRCTELRPPASRSRR